MNIRHCIAGVIVLATTLQSCVIEQDIHFNKDFSGNYKLHFDMSSLNNLDTGDSAATDEPMIPAETFDEMKSQLAAKPGLSNVTSTLNEGVFDLSYDFSDLESLRDANGTGNEMGGMLNFTQKGKKILLDMTPAKDGSEGEEAGQMEAMGDMISFEFNMSFDTPIKKVKSKLATFDPETNSIVFNISMDDMTNKKTNWKTEISFR